MAKESNPADAFHPGTPPGMAVRLWAGIVARVPIGYQDETGFHYGTKPFIPHPQHPPGKPPAQIR